MTRPASSFYPGRRAILAAACLTAGILIWVRGARAQSANPSAAFQFATITGIGNTITASRVPITISPGKTIYKNITFKFNLDPEGNLFLPEGNPQIEDAPQLVISSFRAGKYNGPGSVLSGKTPVYIDGPGALAGGAASWSLSSAAGADVCVYPGSATWYVGPIESNPVAARLRSAGITSPAWSYGVASGPEFSQRCGNGTQITNGLWETGTLIGVSQSGVAVTIASFTNNRRDSAAPVAQITYRLEE